MTEKTDAQPLPKESASPPVPPAAVGDVVANHHRVNLALLQRIPQVSDYVSPTEVMELIRLACEYGIDWTVGLEAKPGEGLEYVTMRANPHGDLERTRVRVRVRAWPDAIDHAEHRFHPDLGGHRANVLSGLLSAAVLQEIRGTPP